MKATDLIAALAERIATEGDLEVFLPAIEPGHYVKPHLDRASVRSVQRVKGKMTLFIEGSKARELGYEEDGSVRALVLA